MAGEKSTTTTTDAGKAMAAKAVTAATAAVQQTKKPVRAKSAALTTKKKKELGEVILYPYMTEKAVRLTEKNKIVFIVPRSVGKGEIKQALEENYGVKVTKINSVISPHGKKKAYVLLSKESSAAELASKLGML